MHTLNIDAARTEYTDKICKGGQGALCCKYLTFSWQRRVFECAKIDGSMKSVIDTKIEKQPDSVIAKGDNCQGQLQLSKAEIPRTCQ